MKPWSKRRAIYACPSTFVLHCSITKLYNLKTNNLFTFHPPLCRAAIFVALEHKIYKHSPGRMVLYATSRGFRVQTARSICYSYQTTIPVTFRFGGDFWTESPGLRKLNSTLSMRTLLSMHNVSRSPSTFAVVNARTRRPQTSD